ncbi:DNA sulfur modification protein DndB [Dehalobacterium formicoaceticum]|uniref:DNA sulfur modification protein DndB n=1 Tax=Dehalobacterium formicoaceticum TaxID=51515 RepID=UPI0031F5F1AE
MKKAGYIELPAVKGMQANMPYYTVMCPLNLVAGLFTYTDNSLPPEMRVQRVLNKQRIPEMKDYILENRDCYVFSALTASVDGELEFVPAKKGVAFGELKISSNSRIIINDGQHRRAAIEAALQDCPSLRYEDIAIVIYHDIGLERSQQMFTDLNKYAIRPTKSLNILYDNRDSFSLLIKECIQKISIFSGRVESEKSTISNRSKELFTLSGIFHASKLLLKNIPHEDYPETLCYYWNAVADNILVWQQAKEKTLSPLDFRERYICAHAIALKALGAMGNQLVRSVSDKKLWSENLRFLQDVQWEKDSPELQGLVMIDGRISSSTSNQRAFAEYLLKKSGWPIASEGRTTQ